MTKFFFAAKQHESILYACLIFLAAVFLYYPLFANDFVYDDFFIIVANPWIQNSVNPAYFFLNPQFFFNSPDAIFNYRPVGSWILSIEFYFFSFQPAFYHTVSLLLHGTNATILFFIFKKIVAKRVLSFFGAMIFLVHPIQSEAVAWAAEHTALWATFFGFTAILLLLKKDSLRRIYYLYLPMAALAVFSKDQLVVLPLLAVAILWTSDNVKRYTKELILLITTIPLYIILRTLFIGSFVAYDEYWGGGIYGTFLTMSNVFVKYMGLIVKGYPLTVNYDTFPETSQIDLPTFFAVSLVGSFVIVLICSIFFRKKIPLITLGLLWFAIPMLPVANFPFPLNSLMNERFLYPALPGAVIILLWLVCSLYSFISKMPRMCRLFSTAGVSIMACVLLGYYSFLTANRLYDWRDDEALWRSASRLALDDRNWLNLNRALLAKGKYEEVLSLYERDAYLFKEEVYADHHAVRFAKVYARMDRLFDAERVLKERYRPPTSNSSGMIAFELGKIYLERGNLVEAVVIFDELAKLRPSNEKFFFSALARYTRSKDDTYVLRDLEKIEDSVLRSVAPLLFRAYSARKEGKWDDVIFILRPIVAQFPIQLEEPYLWLAEAERSLGNTEESFNAFLKLLYLRPASVDARKGFFELREKF